MSDLDVGVRGLPRPEALDEIDGVLSGRLLDVFPLPLDGAPMFGEDLPPDALAVDGRFGPVDGDAIGLVPLAARIVIAMPGRASADSMAVQVRPFIGRDEGVVLVCDGEEVGVSRASVRSIFPPDAEMVLGAVTPMICCMVSSR